MTPEQYEKIAAFLSDHLSTKERIEIEEWRTLSQENERTFREAEAIWRNSNKHLRAEEPETETEWLKLQARITAASTTRPFSSSTLVLKIAASVLLIAGLGYVFYSNNGNREVTAEEFVTMAYLPDSSRVWVNVGSKLEFDEDFADRHVLLDGEAYFEVRPEKVRPFTVVTQHSETTVLGTSFNIREENEDVHLNVAEGLVQFSSKDTTTIKPVLVRAKEQAVLRPAKDVVKSKANPRATDWRKRNNPTYDREVKSASSLLSTKFTWRKNAINQSVIEGSLANQASLASFKNVSLQVTFRKPNGDRDTTVAVVDQTVPAGKTIRFEKRLLDIFTDTQELKLTVLSAEPAE